jgi:hypothetical protein
VGGAAGTNEGSFMHEGLDLLTAIAAILFGYLAGSIPFGLLLTRAAGLADVRQIGSGNIGATNVLRTGSKPIAAATLACDVLKGTVPVLVFYYIAAKQRPCWRGSLRSPGTSFRCGSGSAAARGSPRSSAYCSASTGSTDWSSLPCGSPRRRCRAFPRWRR